MKEEHHNDKERSVAVQIGSISCELIITEGGAAREQALLLKLITGSVFLLQRSVKVPPLLGLGASENVRGVIHLALDSFSEDVTRMTSATSGSFSFYNEKTRERIVRFLIDDISEMKDFFSCETIRATYFGWTGKKSGK